MASVVAATSRRSGHLTASAGAISVAGSAERAPVSRAVATAGRARCRRDALARPDAGSRPRRPAGGAGTGRHRSTTARGATNGARAAGGPYYRRRWRHGGTVRYWTGGTDRRCSAQDEGKDGVRLGIRDRTDIVAPADVVVLIDALSEYLAEHFRCDWCGGTGREPMRAHARCGNCDGRGVVLP
jgi:hypothetical protein